MRKQKREYPEAFKEQAINLLRTSARPTTDSIKSSNNGRPFAKRLTL